MSLPIAPSKGAVNATKLCSRPRETGATIVTSKEWTLPPRPKPGRKPASESGGSGAKKKAVTGAKRSKSSNKEDSMTEEELRVALKQSQDENEKLLRRIRNLENELETHRQMTNNNPKIINSEPEPLDHATTGSGSGSDCGLCDTGGSCVCDHLGLKSASSGQTTLTNGPDLTNFDEYEYFKPLEAVPLRKRVRRDSESKPKTFNKFKRLYETSREHDLTPQFSKPLMKLNEHTNANTNTDNDTAHDDDDDDDMFFAAGAKSSANIDPCGFCSTGTPCLCAETAKAAEQQRRSSTGSCLQCQGDSIRTLFCSTLSSVAEPHVDLGATVSCTEAFQTLSRHRNFNNMEVGEIAKTLRTDGSRVNVESISKTLQEMNNKR
ncbi:hypothetical protein TRICI_001483 [Trichomonascus ciferrii]|uniref:Hap4 transcription factor heteromerisation domain-containing protein n=1 Tax=Trichomonascus ciferrii TaxID=44093 RepID=A0A642VCK7_9ASCO|nr:hypothetical protein TRICI_001483 [Trichomonascus ciferrii]